MRVILVVAGFKLIADSSEGGGNEGWGGRGRGGRGEGGHSGLAKDQIKTNQKVPYICKYR